MTVVKLNGQSVDWKHVAYHYGINDNVANPGGVITKTRLTKTADCLAWCFSHGANRSCEFAENYSGDNCWVKTKTMA